MADTRGTFRLRNVRQEVLNNEYVPIPAVWVKPDAADNAYVGGGTPADTKIDKITFATDGISNVSSANLNHGGGAEAGVFSSSSAGYFAAGSQGTPSSNSFDRRSYVRKLTYASETISNLSNPINHSPSGNGEGPRGGGGTMSATDGYVLGGSGTAGGSEVSWVSKLSFTSETWSAPPNLPSAVHYQGDALGNLDAGYLAGGSPGVRTMVQKITYASDTTSRAPSSDLPAPSRYCAAAGNATAGFIMARQGDSPAHSSIFKLTYASGTASVLPSNMGIALRQTSGTGNLTKGYVSGGYQESGHDWSGVQKLTYETGTGSRNGSLTLSTARQVLAVSARDHGASGEGSLERWFDSATETPNKMYCIGPGTAHDTFNMTTETAASLSLPGMPSLNNGCSAQNTTHSYIHAGPGKQTKVRKITWSTDTGTTLPGTTSRNAENKSGTGNETKGYFTQGGSSPGPCFSGSDRVTYASDTIERVPGADMVGGRPGKFGAQATGTQETGYFMGGGGEWPGFPNYSDTNKLTYATDTNANCPAQMPTGMSMYSGSSASSSTAAYARNYRNPSMHSKVFKLIYSTDTVDTVGNTTVLRNGPAIGGDGTTMYLGGGSAWPNPNRSDFDKLVYATDTISNLPDANLQSARYYTTGSAQRGERIPFSEPPTATPTASTFPSTNPSLNVFCIFKGGYGQPGAAPVSFNAKMTYSNETIAYTPNMHYTIGEVHTMAGGSSTTKGYTAGGWSSGTMGNSRDWRTSHVYATDVTAKIPGSIAGGNGGGGMFGMNSETEFWSGGGGHGSAGYSYVDKLVFATDAVSNNPARISVGRKFCSGIGNKTLGFVCGGNLGPHNNNGNSTNIDKLVYSTGTMSASPSNLSLTGAGTYKWTMAVGTKDQGYIGGGGTNKLVFATETVSTAPTGVGGGSGNGVSSLEAGYTSVGAPADYIIKYTFASETNSTVPGLFPSPANRKRNRMAAVSTSMFAGATSSIPNVI